MYLPQSIGILGVFNLDVYQGKSLIFREVSQNLVVNSGLNTIADLLRGITFERSIATIGFGTNGDPTLPTTASLTNPFLKLPESIAQEGNGRLEINWELGSGEAIGKDIREFGLMTENGLLFARKTRDILQKTAALTLRGTWIIQLTAVV